MPKSFEDRINHFETIVTTPNRVAHSALSLSPDGKERLQFSTVNQMPYEDLGLWR